MPFCPVCKAAGQSNKEYTSHFVKDRPGGNVICPLLLAQECHYCHQKGHTPKFCPRLKEKRERKRQTNDQKVWRDHGFACDGADSYGDYSSPLFAAPPIVKATPPRPKRIGVAFPLLWSLFDMQNQQENEEFVSIWAQRSTAYTSEEEAAAIAAMEDEAEFQTGMDAFDAYRADECSSRYENKMSSLDDCTWG